MPTEDQIRAAVNAYVESFRTLDKDLFLGAIADDVEQEDPVGGSRNVGRDALAGFFDIVSGLVDSIDFDDRELYVSGSRAALVFTLVQHRKDGTEVTLDGVDVFTVDDDGRISLVEGYPRQR